jgi:hypothetical protein
VAGPSFDDPGIVDGNVGADGEDLRAVLLSCGLLLARADIAAVGEIGDVCGLLPQGSAAEGAGGRQGAFGGGLLGGSGPDLEDSVGLPGGDKCPAEGLVGIGAVDGGA